VAFVEGSLARTSCLRFKLSTRSTSSKIDRSRPLVAKRAASRAGPHPADRVGYAEVLAGKGLVRSAAFIVDFSVRRCSPDFVGWRPRDISGPH
jgi:hypothetical protein